MKSHKLRLTAKRQAHAERQSKPPQFKGTPLRNNAAVESRYVASLQTLVAQMTAQVKREVIRLFKTDAALAHYDGVTLDASIGSQARILVNSLTDRFNALFAKRARAMATTMVDSAQAASTTALHSSLAKLTGGVSLRTSIMNPQLTAIYQASVTQNVGLIKSIASEYLTDVQGAVMRSITTGRGLQELIPELEQYEGITHRKATNVALDQTRKTYNAINRGRMQAIGVKRFQWIHSGGAQPRQDHIDMDGEVFSFNNPPVIDQRTGERGIPGQAINCRCTMAPVFDFSDESENKEGKTESV